MIHTKIEQLIQEMSSLQFLDDPPLARINAPYTKKNPKKRPGFSRTLYWCFWHPAQRPPRPSDAGTGAPCAACRHETEIDTGFMNFPEDLSGQLPPSSVLLAG
ncbi:hypothetical protein [Allobaculum sp. JKK-2023]|uniref:hypothetical protein n=1 Tax=Allobaculum sp. JKK-2023 TaxID=3108943 RepID=UPI002B052C2E|nr:hypothetical protein [Allobaculum sp. JKK-2023]